MAGTEKFKIDKKVDDASQESFPASDPPSWTLGQTAKEPPAPAGTVGAPAPRSQPMLPGHEAGGVQRSSDVARLLDEKAIFWLTTGAVASGLLFGPGRSLAFKLALQGGAAYLGFHAVKSLVERQGRSPAH